MFRDKITMGEYARGAQGYAKAKAAFDGLIRQLDAEAGEVQDRANSERFQAALRQAAEARIAFTNDVEATLGPKLEGTKFPFVVIFETVAELLPKLADAWNKIGMRGGRRRKNASRRFVGSSTPSPGVPSTTSRPFSRRS